MSGAHPPFFANATVMQLDPDEIEIPERIGFLHMDKAVAFGRLMATNGQRDPIKVARNKAGKAKPWRLVTGRHRLEGAKLEGLTVWALETAGIGAEDFADIEASENLHRRPLGPLERAMFVQALCQAARERVAREHGDLKQQQWAVKARWDRVRDSQLRQDIEQSLLEEADDTEAKMALVYGWQDSVAEALDLGKSTIKRALRIYRLVVEPFPDLAEALAKHPIVGENEKQLRDVADVRDERLRRKVIEALLADNELSADEARVTIGVDLPAGSAPVAHEKHYSAIKGGWSRLNTSQKRAFVPELAAMLDTPGLRKAMLELLTECEEQPALDVSGILGGGGNG